MANPKKPRNNCRQCGKEPAKATYIYCSNQCQRDFERAVYINKWKAGEITGLNSIGLVSSQVKFYLRKKYQDKCILCGWSKINPVTQRVPLVADHIDGNWMNNTENNLRLVCPNCDALSPTFAALNKGRGRKNRAASKRAQKAKELRL
ncbi:MAG: Raoultella phage Ro1 [Candidatus Parcubacteria bacterium]|jgi:endogenous inhibitor of DNA gyrase (YacG/DUF329 family)